MTSTPYIEYPTNVKHPTFVQLISPNFGSLGHGWPAYLCDIDEDGSEQRCQVWLQIVEPKYTETDLKKFRICPIWTQSDLICGQLTCLWARLRPTDNWTARHDHLSSLLALSQHLTTLVPHSQLTHLGEIVIDWH